MTPIGRSPFAKPLLPLDLACCVGSWVAGPGDDDDDDDEVPIGDPPDDDEGGDGDDEDDDDDEEPLQAAFALQHRKASNIAAQWRPRAQRCVRQRRCDARTVAQFLIPDTDL